MAQTDTYLDRQTYEQSIQQTCSQNKTNLSEVWISSLKRPPAGANWEAVQSTIPCKLLVFGPEYTFLIKDLCIGYQKITP